MLDIGHQNGDPTCEGARCVSCSRADALYPFRTVENLEVGRDVLAHDYLTVMQAGDESLYRRSDNAIRSKATAMHASDTSSRSFFSFDFSRGTH